jgi:hypothetical protein
VARQLPFQIGERHGSLLTSKPGGEAAPHLARPIIDLDLDLLRPTRGRHAGDERCTNEQVPSSPHPFKRAVEPLKCRARVLLAQLSYDKYVHRSPSQRRYWRVKLLAHFTAARVNARIEIAVSATAYNATIARLAKAWVVGLPAPQMACSPWPWGSISP